MKLFVINGPNLNLLGIRETEHYGTSTYAQLVMYVEKVCAREGIQVECFQSNHEGQLVDLIQNAYGIADGIVINPAAYTHTSIAILDALQAVRVPAVEVHISDVSSRESFRQVSYVGQACLARFCGLGLEGYEKAILLLKQHLETMH